MAQYIVYLVLGVVAVYTTAEVLAFAWRRRTSGEVTTFIVLMSCVEGWLVCNILELVTSTERWTVFWGQATYLFIAAAPVAWLAFTLQHAGQSKWVGSAGFWLSTVVPLLTVPIAWTNESHHLLWRELMFVPVGHFLALQVVHGPWFWVQAVMVYGMVAGGALFVSLSHLKSSTIYRRQSRWLVLGAVMPVVWSVVYVAHLIPGLRKDFTPIGLALAGLCFAVGMARDHLFDLRPMARSRLFGATRNAVMVVDARGRLVDANPAADALLAGLWPGRSAEDLVGRPVQEVLSRWPALAEFLNTEPVPDHADFPWPLGDEGWVYECRLLSLEEHGEPAGKLALFHDVTVRYASEESLKHQMAELEASNEQLDAFAGTVAHDLRSPLSTITGFAEMLKLEMADMPAEEVQEQLDIMLRAGYRMLRTIDALLLLAHVHRQEDITSEVLDMGYVVQEALEQVRQALPGQTLEVKLPEAWPWVVGYAPWVIEIWCNYITNAVKYGGTPPVLALGFDAEPLSAPGEDVAGRQPRPCLRFWVRDNGPGLTGEQIERLFHPFNRLEPGRAAGHGLGLWIVRRIADRLGGEVGASSEAGCGSTFWFTLPRADAEMLDEELI